jgi:hypothetical protein
MIGFVEVDASDVSSMSIFGTITTRCAGAISTTGAAWAGAPATDGWYTAAVVVAAGVEVAVSCGTCKGLVCEKKYTPAPTIMTRTAHPSTALVFIWRVYTGL